MKSSKLLAVLITATMLTACENGGPGIMNGGNGLNKQDVGTAVGVIGGGVIGSTIGSGAGQVAATIGGALLGGMLGNTVGKSLDDQDRASYDQASQNALESGETRRWHHGHTSGVVHPHRRYTNDSGQYCREYTQTIVVDGRSHQGHGTACREEDGTWRLVE